jgi:hypothetical protein
MEDSRSDETRAAALFAVLTGMCVNSKAMRDVGNTIRLEVQDMQWSTRLVVAALDAYCMSMRAFRTALRAAMADKTAPSNLQRVSDASVACGAKLHILLQLQLRCKTLQLNARASSDEVRCTLNAVHRDLATGLELTRHKMDSAASAGNEDDWIRSKCDYLFHRWCRTKLRKVVCVMQRFATPPEKLCGAV